MSDTTASPAADSAKHIALIAQETGISVHSVAATTKLIAEGATVPFIARYRKEATGELDEVQITTIRDSMLRLVDIDARLPLPRLEIPRRLQLRNHRQRHGRRRQLPPRSGSRSPTRRGLRRSG